MLDGLSTYISLALLENQSTLLLNPQSAPFVEPKIVMLQNPRLASEILTGGRWASGHSTSANGRNLAIGCVFALEAMRSDGNAAVRTLEALVPFLENFLDMAAPVGMIRVWYGFVIGTNAGGGAIYTEDRASYEARTSADRAPFEAVLGYDLARSFVRHESLVQLLELYAYNVRRTREMDPTRWIYTRQWTPGLASNLDVAALLDIYQLIGHDTMRQSVSAIARLAPLPDQPLSPAVIQAFLAPVPAALQSQVSEKLARVTR